MRWKWMIVGLLAGLASLAAAFFLYEQGLVRLNYPDPLEFPVLGLDVSRHQRAIEWPKVQEEGIHFVFIKATEGRDYQDPEFKRNWNGARAAGIARGAYHFFTFCGPGLEQASNFARALAGDLGELPPVADVEFGGNCKGWSDVADIRQELSVFLERIETVVGRAPIVYSTDEAAAGILLDRFDRYPKWARKIMGRPENEAWLFWQFANNGRIQGISTLVDLNVFHGNVLEFAQWLSRSGGGEGQGPEGSAAGGGAWR